MFTGDRSGDWLYRALHKAGYANQAQSVSAGDGLILTDAYITATAHCAPPDNKPLKDEIENCRPYLERELRLFTSRAKQEHSRLVLLALGGIGFAATLKILQTLGYKIPKPKPKFGHCHVVEIDEHVAVLASYHPSQQNTQTGRLTEEMFDRVFETAHELVTRQAS